MWARIVEFLACRTVDNAAISFRLEILLCSAKDHFMTCDGDAGGDGSGAIVLAGLNPVHFTIAAAV